MFIALILTVVIEAAVMFAMTRSKEWVKFNLYCNLITNPLLNLGLMYVTRHAEGLYFFALLTGELLVLISEWILYKLMSDANSAKCFVRSLVTNAVSCAIGLFLSLFW